MKRFGFFNSINGDRKYLASDISEALDIATTTGIKQEEGIFEVTPYEDMTIKINPGSALIFGCFYSNDEDELIKLDMADGELNRIDRIAIRYDRFDRSVDTVVLKGTNALNPTPPTPLRNENQFDLVLADIYIRKAATEISASDITDMRESELCGYIGVKGAVSQLEFDAHLSGDSGKHITESGANSFGNYTRYDDGTQECWQIFASSLKPTQQEGSIFKSGKGILSFPATFIDIPIVQVSSVFSGRWANVTSTPSEVRFEYEVLSAKSSELTGNIFYSAIGRWK